MIKTQRKAHRAIWWLMALVLPVLIVLSIARMPKAPILPSGVEQVQDSQGEVLKKVDTEYIKMIVWGEGTIAKQLEIQVKAPLQAASALVYVNGDEVLGQVGKVGTYHFAIANAPKSITVRDVLKNRELLTIEL